MKKIIALILSLLLVVGIISGIIALTKIKDNTSYIPQMVTFTIVDKEYSVKQGETWQDFLDSENAPSNLIVSSDGYVYVKDSYGAYLYDETKERIVADSTIKKGSYTLDLFLIHFQIEGKTYAGENGMTWEEWIDSKYSDSTLEIDSDGKVIQKTSGFFLTAPEYGVQYVYSNDFLNNDWDYVVM